MKVKVETALFQVPFGSHLYGTNGPTSDLDFKVVCLPSLDTLLLNTAVTNRKVLPEGMKEGQKMDAGEAEYEYIPLQIFLDDFFNGQTYALEIAFAVLQDRMTFEGCSLIDKIGSDSEGVNYIYGFVDDLVRNFLTRNVSKMVGYAVSQSRNYGLKTERFTSLKQVVEMIEKYVDETGPIKKSVEKIALSECPTLIFELCQQPHVTRCEILNGGGGTEMAPAIEVCGKQFPLTTALSTIVKSLKGSLATYGDRVKKFEGAGVDWKALSHAIRITEQVLELSQHGRFTFPRPNASFLRNVKEGFVDIEVATNYLTECFNKIDVAMHKSVLRERTPALEEEFREFKLQVLHHYYLEDHLLRQNRDRIDSLLFQLKEAAGF